VNTNIENKPRKSNFLQPTLRQITPFSISELFMRWHSFTRYFY